MFRPLLFETRILPVPDTYRLPEHVLPEGSCEHYLDQVERLFSTEGDTIAALIVEPLVQAAAGMIMHPPGFLAGLRRLTRAHGILLIADEVAVGFGRTGKMFACEHEDVTPDFLCLAKGLTAGYLPLAATLTTSEIWHAFLGTYEQSRTFYHGHTYSGNPLGAAVALANLDLFEREQTLARLPEKVARLNEHLRAIEKLPHVGNVRQRGLIGAVELVQDAAAKVPFPWHEKRGIRVCEFARRQGVLLRPLGNVIVIMPPLSITLDQLDKIAACIAEGITRAVT
jgi:adenosylmethionine-8-amino-7-oxononanoate aminotransferase